MNIEAACYAGYRPNQTTTQRQTVQTPGLLIDFSLYLSIYQQNIVMPGGLSNMLGNVEPMQVDMSEENENDAGTEEAEVSIDRS